MKHSALDLEQKHSGEVIVIIGNSPSLNTQDLHLLDGLTTIGCNRALRHPYFWPMYLLESDRQAYIQERDKGRLATGAQQGITLMLSTTIFDPKIRCIRADGSDNQEVPVQPEPDFDWTAWRVSAVDGPLLNLDTFEEDLASFANIAGPMLATATIMGASVIGCVGIELEWPKEGPSHMYGDGREVGAYPPARMDVTMKYFNEAREQLEKRGVRVYNLSPVRNSPFAECFGTYNYEAFIRKFRG